MNAHRLRHTPLKGTDGVQPEEKYAFQRNLHITFTFFSVRAVSVSNLLLLYFAQSKIQFIVVDDDVRSRPISR